MKKGLLWIVSILALITVVLIISAYAFTGEKISAERTIYVDAPPSATYSHVENLKSWERWSPWYKMDPNMKMAYQNGGVGKGASYTFDSEKENLGSGKLTITDVHKNKAIETFVEMNGNQGYGSWDFSQKDRGTQVTWKFSFEPQSLSEKIMGLFFNRMMGPSLEDGLKGLKNVAETVPPPGFDARASLEKKMQELRDSISNARGLER